MSFVQLRIHFGLSITQHRLVGVGPLWKTHTLKCRGYFSRNVSVPATFRNANGTWVRSGLQEHFLY